MTSVKQQIKDKIDELQQKKWKNKAEENQASLVKGRLNPERRVQFGTVSMLDIYEHGRFALISDALYWARSLLPDDEGFNVPRDYCTALWKMEQKGKTLKICGCNDHPDYSKTGETLPFCQKEKCPLQGDK